jgi:hypothetical protein
VVASDAFFPFRDGLDVLAKAGATAVIQPGGSMRDAEVIAAADEQASRWSSPASATSATDRDTARRTRRTHGIMNLLVIGSGGREHALAWRLAQSPKVAEGVRRARQRRHGARGRLRTCHHRYPDAGRLRRARADRLTVVGPEAPLAAGVVDAFRAPACRSSADAGRAQLESSKDFAKQFMQRHKIPTAKYQTFSDAAGGARLRRREGAPIVIKADGLAAGKGVVVAMDSRRGARRHRRCSSTTGWAIRRRARGDRGIPRGRGSQLHRHGATAATRCRSPPARTTSACSTATRAPTPAAWAPTRRRRW